MSITPQLQQMASFRTTQTHIATLLENLSSANESVLHNDIESMRALSADLLKKYRSNATDMQNEFESILESFDQGRLKSENFAALLEAERLKGMFTVNLAEEMGHFLEGICKGIYDMIKNVQEGKPFAGENITNLFSVLDQAMGAVVGMSRVASCSPNEVVRAINFVTVERKALQDNHNPHLSRFHEVAEELMNMIKSRKFGRPKLETVEENEGRSTHSTEVAIPRNNYSNSNQRSGNNIKHSNVINQPIKPLPSFSESIASSEDSSSSNMTDSKDLESPYMIKHSEIVEHKPSRHFPDTRANLKSQSTSPGTPVGAVTNSTTYVVTTSPSSTSSTSGNVSSFISPTHSNNIAMVSPLKEVIRTLDATTQTLKYVASGTKKANSHIQLTGTRKIISIHIIGTTLAFAPTTTTTDNDTIRRLSEDRKINSRGGGTRGRTTNNDNNNTNKLLVDDNTNKINSNDSSTRKKQMMSVKSNKSLKQPYSSTSNTNDDNAYDDENTLTPSATISNIDNKHKAKVKITRNNINKSGIANKSFHLSLNTEDPPPGSTTGNAPNNSLFSPQHYIPRILTTTSNDILDHFFQISNSSNNNNNNNNNNNIYTMTTRCTTMLDDSDTLLLTDRRKLSVPSTAPTTPPSTSPPAPPLWIIFSNLISHIYSYVTIDPSTSTSTTTTTTQSTVSSPSTVLPPLLTTTTTNNISSPYSSPHHPHHPLLPLPLPHMSSSPLHHYLSPTTMSTMDDNTSPYSDDINNNSNMNTHNFEITEEDVINNLKRSRAGTTENVLLTLSPLSNNNSSTNTTRNTISSSRSSLSLPPSRKSSIDATNCLGTQSLPKRILPTIFNKSPTTTTTAIDTSRRVKKPSYAVNYHSTFSSQLHYDPTAITSSPSSPLLFDGSGGGGETSRSTGTIMTTNTTSTRYLGNSNYNNNGYYNPNNPPKTITIYPINTLTKGTDTSDLPFPTFSLLDNPPTVITQESTLTSQLRQTPNQLLLLLETYQSVLSFTNKSALSILLLQNTTSTTTDQNHTNLPIIISSIFNILNNDLNEFKNKLIAIESEYYQNNILFENLQLFQGITITKNDTDDTSKNFHNFLDKLFSQSNGTITQLLILSLLFQEFRLFFDSLQHPNQEFLKHIRVKAMIQNEYEKSLLLFTDCQSQLIELKDKLFSFRSHFQHKFRDYLEVTTILTGNQMESTSISRSKKDITSLRLQLEVAEGKILKLQDELEEAEKELEQDQLEIFALEQSQDRTPGALLFYTLLQDENALPTIQQIILQLTKIAPMFDNTDSFDLVSLRKRLKVCCDCLPSLESLVSKYTLMYQKWTQDRWRAFGSRKQISNAQVAVMVCPTCSLDIRVVPSSAILHQNLLLGVYMNNTNNSNTYTTTANNNSSLERNKKAMSIPKNTKLHATTTTTTANVTGDHKGHRSSHTTTIPTTSISNSNNSNNSSNNIRPYNNNNNNNSSGNNSPSVMSVSLTSLDHLTTINSTATNSTTSSGGSSPLISLPTSSTLLPVIPLPVSMSMSAIASRNTSNTVIEK